MFTNLVIYLHDFWFNQKLSLTSLNKLNLSLLQTATNKRNKLTEKVKRASSIVRPSPAARFQPVDAARARERRVQRGPLILRLTVHVHVFLRDAQINSKVFDDGFSHLGCARRDGFV